MFIQQLVQLGFTDKEAEIYQTLHQIGPSLASTLARLTKIKRTSIYDLLNKLQARNLIYSFKQGKYTFFAIDDIKKLYYEEKEKLNTAAKLVEQLKQNQKNLTELQIYYYRGQEGYRELYEDVLKSGAKEILAWIHLDSFYKFIDPKREEQWTKERINKKIKAKLILQDSPMTKTFRLNDEASLRESRIANKNTLHATCLVYSNYTVFFDPSESTPTGIRIHNKEISDLQKNVFEQNWNSLNKTN